MLDTGCLLERAGNPDLSEMLIDDSVVSGDNRTKSFENPASRNQHQVSFCFLLKKAILKLVSFINFLSM